MKKVELLAPAGDKNSLIGAINAGANAVYVAGKKFGARANASNFEDDELVEMIQFAHLRGARLFVTVNTLIFDEEMSELLTYTDFLVQHHIDAFIVQDFGLLSILIHRYPHTDIHVSTQANTHTIEQAMWLKELGVKRIVLARETNIDLITQIKALVDVEIEVFIHGALCVSYSGNCLHSSMIGYRSGNRGECAQSCRLPYTLTTSDQSIQEPSYLMSTKDLMTIKRIPELIESGIDSFKIEGRMRKPEYVVTTVLEYASAIDSYYQGVTPPLDTAIDRLKRVFNRDYTEGYLFDITPTSINQSYRPNHIGVEAGKVIQYKHGKVGMLLLDDLSVGDGVRFLFDRDYGMVVSRILQDNESVKTAKMGEFVTLDVAQEIPLHTIMMKTQDIVLERGLEQYLHTDYKKICLTGFVHCVIDKPIELHLHAMGHKVFVQSDFFVQQAQKNATTKEQIMEQLSKLGNTPFFYESLHLECQAGVFVPVKVLNDLRRSALQLLEEKLLYRDQGKVVVSQPFLGKFPNVEELTCARVETMDQLIEVIQAGIQFVYVEEDLIFDASLYPTTTFYKAKKRIQTDHQKDASKTPLVINELGTLVNQPSSSWIADQYLNTTNIHTVALFADHGAQVVVLSPELHQHQILSMVTRYQETFHHTPNLQMVVYGRMDLMISKYCPIAKTFGVKLSHCTLCSKKQYVLTDRVGVSFPLKNDGFCNIRMLHAKPLMLFDYLSSLSQAGIKQCRLDFTIESKEETKQVLEWFFLAKQQALPRMERQLFTQGRFIK
ncbi:MAG: DUF3656 domain-containing protein [bacterium]|nr:DUF3656 domain-containing protein [bacterium]